VSCADDRLSGGDRRRSEPGGWRSEEGRSPPHVAAIIPALPTERKLAMGKTTQQWVLEIAIALENWRTSRADSVKVEMEVTTPSGAVEYLVRSIPAADREAVRDALPVLLPADFSEAAWRIRQAATRLPI